MLFFLITLEHIKTFRTLPLCNPRLVPAGAPAISTSIIPANYSGGSKMDLTDFCKIFSIVDSIKQCLQDNTIMGTHAFSHMSSTDLQDMGFKLSEVIDLKEAIYKGMGSGAQLNSKLFVTFSLSWDSRLLTLYTLSCVRGKPRSADSRQKFTTTRSSAGVNLCFPALKALMDTPPVTKRCNMLLDTLCMSATAW